MRKKSDTNLSFGELKVSQKGILSVILGILSLAAAVSLIVISGIQKGNAGKIVGACGIVAVVAAVIGVCYGVLGTKEADCKHMPAYIGFIINLVLLVSWGCLFAIGV